MEIIISKGKIRNTLKCKREDGTFTVLDLGPEIPNHDIAHYVVEKKFKLENGFYGKIKSGMTIEELSDKEIIKTLDSEIWLSEIMARNIQSIGSGAVKVDEFVDLVNWEAESIVGVEVPQMNLFDVEKMKLDFNRLCEKWDLLLENSELKLIF